MKLYVASSWRNEFYPMIVDDLRRADHTCYDFRNPEKLTDAAKTGAFGHQGIGFIWSELDPNWKNWSAQEYRENLKKPRAQEGFHSDFDAMQWADCCVLVLPSGRSAHLEAGWCAGKGKKVIILTRDGEEPELMALMADAICINIEEVIAKLSEWEDDEFKSKVTKLIDGALRA